MRCVIANASYGRGMERVGHFDIFAACMHEWDQDALLDPAPDCNPVLIIYPSFHALVALCTPLANIRIANFVIPHIL
jgi:hypothetical protein